jgi:hypothetical protein
VQAYRYEYFENSDLEKFLLNSRNGVVFNNKHIANEFHWILHLEKENKETNTGIVLAKYNELYEEFYRILNSQPENDLFVELLHSFELQHRFRDNTLKTA